MAIESIGYPTDIGNTNIDWANIQLGLGRRYWVSSGAFVTVSTGGARQVTISAGWFGGKGITDHNTAAATVDLPTVTSGTTKYFLVGAERNWNPEDQGTTFTYIDAGTSATTLPSFPQDGDVSDGSGIDFQPLALVPLTGGSATPGTPIDLRVLTSAGNILIARDERALQYMGFYGQTIRIGDDLWTYHAFPSGWVKDKEIVVSGPSYGNPLGVGGAGGWYTIGAPANLLQYGRRSRTTGWHQVVIQASRGGASIPFSTASGSLTDDTIMTLSATEWKPPYRVRGSGEYRHGGATYGCTPIINTDGSIGIISGAPTTEISKRTDGGWSFRANFEWMSA